VHVDLPSAPIVDKDLEEEGSSDGHSAGKVVSQVVRDLSAMEVQEPVSEAFFLHYFSRNFKLSHR
jgi:hypothetical protein